MSRVRRPARACCWAPRPSCCPATRCSPIRPTRRALARADGRASAFHLGDQEPDPRGVDVPRRGDRRRRSAYTVLPIKQFPNVVFPGRHRCRSPRTARRRPRSRPRSPGRSRTPWPASPACATSSRRSARAHRPPSSSSSSARTCRRSPTRCASGSTRPGSTCRARSIRRTVAAPRHRLPADPHLRGLFARHVGQPALLVRRRHRLARRCRAPTASPRSSRVGGIDREINVIVDPDRMAAQGLTATAAEHGALAPSTSTSPAGASTSADASRRCGCWAQRADRRPAARSDHPHRRRPVRQAVRRRRRRRRRRASRAASPA